MRKLIYYIATTLDGFIARDDGSFDGFSWDDDFKVNQVVFGTGFPLFSGGIKPVSLTLTDSKIFKSGHLLLYYQLER